MNQTASDPNLPMTRVTEEIQRLTQGSVEEQRNNRAPKTAVTSLPIATDEVEAFLQAPKAVQGRLLAEFRRGESVELTGLEKALALTSLIRDTVRPRLEQIENDPDGFADFQTAFIAKILGTDDSVKLDAIHYIILRTYREANASGLNSQSRPNEEAAIEDWAMKRDALDRPATRAVQELLSPLERRAFDAAFIGIMGIDLGQGDGLWNRFTVDEKVVVFPSEDVTAP